MFYFRLFNNTVEYHQLKYLIFLKFNAKNALILLWYFIWTYFIVSIQIKYYIMKHLRFTILYSIQCEVYISSGGWQLRVPILPRMFSVLMNVLQIWNMKEFAAQKMGYSMWIICVYWPFKKCHLVLNMWEWMVFWVNV